MNRVEIEKLLLWLVPITLFSVLANHALLQFNAELLDTFKEGATVTRSVEDMSWMERHFTYGERMLYLNVIQSLPFVLIRVVIGVWLYIQAQGINGRRWLWGLSGLFIGYWALAVFFFARFIETNLFKEKISSG